MPAQQQQQGSVLAAVRNRVAKAMAENAGKPVEINNNDDLPPGINNGVAKVVDCKFDLYKSGDNAGKPYFRAAAVIVEPEEVYNPITDRVERVVGRQTSIMLPCCDTKTQAGKETRVEEHVARIRNEFLKLGLDPDQTDDPGDLEAHAAALRAAAPYTSFSTRPRKDQKTNEVTGSWQDWNGAVEDYVPPSGDDPSAHVREEAPEPAPAARRDPASAANSPPARPAAEAAPAQSRGAPAGKGGGAAGKNAPAPARPGNPAPPTPQPAGKGSPPTKPPAKALPAAAPGPGTADIDALVDRADGPAGADAEAAQQELQDLALARGLTDDDLTAAPDWAAVRDLIRAADGGGGKSDYGAEDAGDAADGDAGGWEPAVGDVYKYRPRTRGPGGRTVLSKKAYDVEVTAVVPATRQCSLSNLDDGKSVYNAVPWEDLERDE